MANEPDTGPEAVDTQWWREAIVAALASSQPVVEVRTPLKHTVGNSRPALVIGSDGRRYVIKGLQAGRSMGRRLFADHLVGRLGAVAGAPVAEVALVSLPFEIADESFATMHLQPGIVHGSVLIPEVIDGWWGFEHLDVLDNRRRFAQLAVLFGWVGADDHQFVYRTSPPELVFSCDHDHFLPGPRTGVVQRWRLPHLPNRIAT